MSFLANLFVAPASYFQNRYLDEVRGLSPGAISLFTVSTATPAALGFVVGGKIADMHGRRKLLVVAVPLSTVLLIWSFSVGGFGAVARCVRGGVRRRHRLSRVRRVPHGDVSHRQSRPAAGIVTAAALVGGSFGLLAVGKLLDLGWSYGKSMGLMAFGEILAVLIILRSYPETAHKDLDELSDEPAMPVIALPDGF